MPARLPLSRLKIRQLRIIVAIAEEASILHAGRRLGIPQSSATKLVQDLEEQLGQKLFNRSNRGALATPYGEVLVRHARLVLAQLDNAAQEIDDLAGGRGGRIVVGTLLAASTSLLPSAIAMPRRERPNVTVVVREGTNDRLMPALARGEMDLVVGRLSEHRHREDVVREPLIEDSACIVCRAGHPATRMRSLSLARLADQDWILPPPDTTLRRQVAGTECARGDIAMLSLQIDGTSGPIGISRREGADLSPATRALVEALRKVAGDS